MHRKLGDSLGKNLTKDLGISSLNSGSKWCLEFKVGSYYVYSMAFTHPCVYISEYPTSYSHPTLHTFTPCRSLGRYRQVSHQILKKNRTAHLLESKELGVREGSLKGWGRLVISKLGKVR